MLSAYIINVVESIFVAMSPYHLFISLSVSTFLVFSSVFFYNIFKPRIDIYSSSNVMSIDDLIGAEIGGTLGEMIRDKEYDDANRTSNSNVIIGSSRVTQEISSFNLIVTQLNATRSWTAENDSSLV